MKPYVQHDIDSKMFTRTFNCDVEPLELQWHYDEDDRTVEVLENAGWMIQFDDGLPVLLEGMVHIPKNVFHRVIKGDGILKVCITLQT